MTDACDIFARHCVAGIEADAHRCRRNVHNSTALLTALIDKIGYDAAEQIAHEVAASPCNQRNIRQLVIDRGLLTAEEFDRVDFARAMSRDWDRSDKRQLCNRLPKVSACTSACLAAATPASRRC